MPQKPIDMARVKRIIEGWNKIPHLDYTAAGRKLGTNRETLRRYLQIATDAGMHVESPTNQYTQNHRGGMRTEEFEIPDLPDDELPIDEIIDQRKREFAQKKKHEEATKLIPLKIKIVGAIGILHFGDPHVDDDGTDIAAIERHALLTHREGIIGANVGDTTNAWVGRLARLYGDQNCGRKRALRIAEWFIKLVKWGYMVGGNHDGWAGEDDPIKWIARQSSALYRPSEARLQLTFPEGAPFTINARHDFAGASMYNPAHGAMKAIHMGVRDDLSTCGHRHVSGYGVLKDPATGKTCHALQVGSYKIFDRFAKEKGFRDQSLGPAAMTVITPTLPAEHPDRCKVFWDPEEGADYVKFKRGAK